MQHPHYAVQCCDDAGEIPAGIEHLPPILLNPDAHPLALLSATSARAQRIKHILEPYMMMSESEASACLDIAALHGFLTSLYHQSDELCQMLSGCIDHIDDERLRQLHT